jgi:hypothetical protein
MNKSRKLPFLLLAAGLLIVIIWLAISAMRVWQATQSLSSRQAQAEGLLSNGLMQINADDAEAMVLGIRADVVELSSAAGPFIPLAPLFDWLPRIGPTLAVAPELMEIAEAASEAAVYGMRGFKPALLLLQDDVPGTDGKMPEIVRLLDAAGEDLALSSTALTRVAAARNKISETSALPWRIQTLLAQLDNGLPLAQDGLSMARLLPELTGVAGRRTYLIVAQNEDELRPTGGFVSGAGLLQLEEGDIQSLSFLSSDVVDDWQNKPYDLPPQPFQDFMGMDIFLFRDTNFWPNFPASAEKMMESYSYGQDIHLDGVIAVDQHFLSKLLEVVGPLEVLELATTLDAVNVIAEMRAAWEPTDDDGNWIAERKSFMGPLAAELFRKLMSSLDSVDLVWLARTMGEAVAQRHFQVYMRDPVAQDVLAEIGWAGSQINRMGQDFLLVVDTNMGFNKANAALARSLDYHVLLNDDGGGEATLTIDYDHLSEPNGQSCEPFAAIYSTEIRYTNLIEDCYWNYLRVYVPEGSVLVESSRHPVSGDSLLTGHDWEGYARSSSDPVVGLTEFSNFLLLPRGARATVTFSYELPRSIIRAADGSQTYHLALNKQAGVDSQPLVVSVELPPGMRLKNASPEPIAVDGSIVSFAAEQQTDLSFSLTFEPVR